MSNKQHIPKKQKKKANDHMLPKILIYNLGYITLSYLLSVIITLHYLNYISSRVYYTLVPLICYIYTSVPLVLKMYTSVTLVIFK